MLFLFDKVLLRKGVLDRAYDLTWHQLLMSV